MTINNLVAQKDLEISSVFIVDVHEWKRVLSEEEL